ncbi:MAG: AAA family ATPase [Deltaproteobacteria bacterium]|nr:AAA family ATPase [Deltaproteobacteria bacterium]
MRSESISQEEKTKAAAIIPPPAAKPQSIDISLQDLYREAKRLFGTLSQLLAVSSLSEILVFSAAAEKEFFLFLQEEDKNVHELEMTVLLPRLFDAIIPLRDYNEDVSMSLRLVSLSETLSNLEEVARVIESGETPYRLFLSLVLSRWRELVRLEIRRISGQAKLQLTSHDEETTDGNTTITLTIRNLGPAVATNIRVELLVEGKSSVYPKMQVLPSLAPEEARTLTFAVRGEVAYRIDGLATYDDRLSKNKEERHRVWFVKRVEATKLSIKALPITWWLDIRNPYLPGTSPPDPKEMDRLFVGRDDILRFVEENLVNAASERIVVLYGHRRMGKTWTLLRLMERLPDKYLPVYINVQEFSGVNGVPPVLQNIADEIVRSLKRRGGVDPAAISSIRVPALEQYVSNYPYFFKRVFLSDVQEVLGDKRLLWLVDEAQCLDDMVQAGHLPATFLEFLRDLMQFSHKIAFVFAGVREITEEYWSVFFNIAVHRRIGVLSDEDASKLIVDPLKPYGVEYDPAAVSLIRQFTGNHPYFIQLLCDRVVSGLNRQQLRHVGGQLVEAAVEDVVTHGTSNLQFYWKDVMDEKERAVAGTMQDILRQQRTSDLATILIQMRISNPKVPSDDLSSVLQNLVKKDIIEKAKGLRDTYRFKMGLIERYIEAHEAYAMCQERIGRLW